ncbi:hypothetical protein ACO1O0_009249 [Amphichorda felina]
MTSSRISNRSPILPLHKPATERSASQYAMDELEPWPEDDDEPFRDRKASASRSRMSTPASACALSLPRSPSPDAWQDEASVPGSSFEPKPRPMFSGPPRPIVSSVAIGQASASRNTSTDRKGTSWIGQGKQRVIGSLLFDHKHEYQPEYQSDSIWLWIRRREKALENEVQQYLDLQANGLVAGSQGMIPPGSDMEEYSDAGSSTPTGTFYSTATSKSRMVSSLYVPTRSTPDGNVIPVRQPKNSRPQGLRAARMGLRRSIAALAELKGEEDAHVDDALTERRRALIQLNRLSKRREIASTELQTLEGDEEEPLGQELRELGARYDTISQEIRELEEKLVGMRNNRRWIRGKMDDVKNRREAGLSSYRGALKDIDSEVETLMLRPPVQPLDSDQLQQTSSGRAESTGGIEFLRLIPERRTVDMAKSWWGSEISILEQRKAQINADRQALEEGGALWAEVIGLVSEYESRLRQLMEGPQPSLSSKGKERIPSQEELIKEQLPEMYKVIEKLQMHLHLAEDKSWNLLICAIGAELEAFTEAQEMLRGLVGIDEGPQDVSQPADTTEQQTRDGTDRHDESSDNEVPPDLLVSRVDEHPSQPPSMTSPEVEPKLQADSQNDVPPEFLAEHKDKSD